MGSKRGSDLCIATASAATGIDRKRCLEATAQRAERPVSNVMGWVLLQINEDLTLAITQVWIKCQFGKQRKSAHSCDEKTSGTPALSALNVEQKSPIVALPGEQSGFKVGMGDMHAYKLARTRTVWTG